MDGRMDGLIAYVLSKKHTDSAIQEILDAGFKVQVEQDRSILSRTGQQMTLYLIPKESSLSTDTYDEYVYTNKWEQIGSTDIDLNYEDLENKPQINGNALSGNKSGSELGLQNAINIPSPSADAYDQNTYLDLRNNQLTFQASKVLTVQSGKLPSLGYWNSVSGFVSLTTSAISSYQLTVGINGNIPINENGSYIRLCDYEGQIRKEYYLTDLGVQYQKITTLNGGSWDIGSWKKIVGPKGDPGDDYILTAQDKTDIANIVLGELPTTEGVLYGN